MSEASKRMSQTDAGVAEGRRRREELPRQRLAALGDRHPGFDPVMTLRTQAEGRVPELLAIRDERMAVDEFAFLRGSAAIMAYDLAMTPSTQIETQLCGDAHVANFGVFASPERRLTFDVNDFDETLRGPFDWDVKRMAASAAVAMRGLGSSEKAIAKALRRGVRTYREAMINLAGRGNLDVWYLSLDVDSHIDELRAAFTDESGSRVDQLLARARKKDSKRAFRKLVGETDGTFGFIADPPLIVPLDELLASGGRTETSSAVLQAALEGYAATLSSDRQHLLSTYEPVDMARKVVGVGSVGTRCFVVLLMGRDEDDPLILQIKEATTSVLEAHLGADHHVNAGDRVVAGQRLLQTTPDAFLGSWRAEYSPTEHHDFYLRMFHDSKASVDFTRVNSEEIFTRYIELCAWALARAHARAGDRAAMAAYLGRSDSFDRAVADWSMAYVDRNAADYRAFLATLEPAEPS